ncbi:MAG: phage tail assembly chaperone [Armatimonadota bacterium]
MDRLRRQHAGPKRPRGGRRRRKRLPPEQWWREVKRCAFGPLGLAPAAFWALTLRDFLELLDGYQYRLDLEQADKAYWTWWLLKAWGCDIASPRDLLPGKKPARRNPQRDIEHLQRFYEEHGPKPPTT